MKELRKIIKKAGPLGLVVVAAAAIFLLMNMQPKVSSVKAQTVPPIRQEADAVRELVEMRADAFLTHLQRVNTKNPAVFSFNVSDTSGSSLVLRITNEASGKTIFFDDRVLTPQQQSLYKNGGIIITPASIQLPVKRKNGLLLVLTPSVLAFSMAKQGG